ncbi:unnamed protein product [Caenorhabditis angaria]|uniref:ISXO2-like transposase domain-containing protein n=1 Tax=Caenorhabditis angaria TaxID=860376 RepID=A0A9P1J447_9PELO|nr:unnamed protein product [Caenorhabditis angaria]
MLNRRQIWIFGLIERGTDDVAMMEVPRRDAATLLPLIQQHVEPGTLIVSDGWRAYGGIKNLQEDYDHKFVNHKVNFVDPTDPRVHTQSIESTWRALKTSLKQYYGIPHSSVQTYMYIPVYIQTKMERQMSQRPFI